MPSDAEGERAHPICRMRATGNDANAGRDRTELAHPDDLLASSINIDRRGPVRVFTDLKRSRIDQRSTNLIPLMGVQVLGHQDAHSVQRVPRPHCSMITSSNCLSAMSCG